MNKEAIIKDLQLNPHVEGGFFVLTYTSSRNITIQKENETPERALMTIIYYMLTVDSPFNHFHKNSSDIVHFFHLGAPMKYHVITPEGQISSAVLGPNISAGQRPELMVPAGCWKAAELLCEGDGCPDYGLISEAVAPGFDYADWAIAKKEDIQKIIPQKWQEYKRYVKP